MKKKLSEEMRVVVVDRFREMLFSGDTVTAIKYASRYKMSLADYESVCKDYFSTLSDEISIRQSPDKGL